MEQLELHDVSRLAGDVLDEVEVAVVGKRETLTLVLAAILAGGHVLLEDFPGLGQDAGGTIVRPDARPRLRSRSVHTRSVAGGSHGIVRV